MTVADIYFYDTTTFINWILPNLTSDVLLEKYPLLRNVVDKVKGSENIKKYLESKK